MTDKEYMDIAIEISKKATYPYGAIIVKDNKIIGRSDSNSIVSSTPFCHAELAAIEDALNNTSQNVGVSQSNLEGAIIYSSCEPCIMCMGAILWSSISILVYGATLEDSLKYIAPEVLLPVETISKNCENKDIEIISEIERDNAVKVLKNWRENNK